MSKKKCRDCTYRLPYGFSKGSDRKNVCLIFSKVFGSTQSCGFKEIGDPIQGLILKL